MGSYFMRRTYQIMTGSIPGQLIPSGGFQEKKPLYEAIKSALFLSNLTYITVTTKSMIIWKCSDYIDGKQFLVYHPDIMCWEGEHIQLMAISVLGILFYVITWPCVMCMVFQKGYEENLYEKSKSYILVWGFLFKRYEREWFWWQLVVVLNKFVIVMIKVFWHKNVYQLPLALLATFMFIMAQSFARPFDSTPLDRLQSMCLVSEFAFILIGILINSSAYDVDTMTMFWFTVLVLSMFSVGLCICRDLQKYRIKEKIRATAAACNLTVENQLGTPEAIDLFAFNHWFETATREETQLWGTMTAGKTETHVDDAALLHECLIFSQRLKGRPLAWLCMEQARTTKTFGEHMMYFLRHDTFLRHLNSNGDDGVDLEEWRAAGYTDEEFLRADIDGSGKISEAEYHSWHQTREWEAHHHQQSPAAVGLGSEFSKDSLGSSTEHRPDAQSGLEEGRPCGQTSDMCGCGNRFMIDALFCRHCGAPRPDEHGFEQAQQYRHDNILLRGCDPAEIFKEQSFGKWVHFLSTNGDETTEAFAEFVRSVRRSRELTEVIDKEPIEEACVDDDGDAPLIAHLDNPSDSVGIELEASAVRQQPSEQGLSKEERDLLIKDLFDRYDVDASGTLNTREELKMLTTNCLFKLNRVDNCTRLFSPEEVKGKLDCIGELTDENAWDPEKFIVWFDAEFCGPDSRR